MNLNGKDRQKPKQAAALSYSPETDKAPKLIAVGQGQIAEKIIETAKNSDIPIYKDEKLIQALNNLKIGDNIPPELYEIVAEILVFVSSVDRKFGELKDEH